MGLALIVAACGTSTGGGSQPTPTTNPATTVTPSSAPVPCTGWRIVASPTNTKYPHSSLSAVSALSPTAVWAVEATFTDGQTTNRVDSLIERWDGSTWHIVASPALPKDAIGGGWNGVVALSATNAWAVGSFRWLSDSHPMIAHWDGTSWQNVVADPNTYGSLESEAAGGANEVRAAGTLMTGPSASSGTGHVAPLIEKWNGTSWQIATTPGLPSGALLPPEAVQGLDIATDGAGNYWAVGSYLTQIQYQTLPLILHLPIAARVRTVPHAAC
jgi:hypothetical protein